MCVSSFFFPPPLPSACRHFYEFGRTGKRDWMVCKRASSPECLLIRIMCRHIKFTQEGFSFKTFFLDENIHIYLEKISNEVRKKMIGKYILFFSIFRYLSGWTWQKGSINLIYNDSYNEKKLIITFKYNMISLVSRYKWLVSSRWIDSLI